MQDFITLKRSHQALAWQPEIVGRRVISWLSNSVVVLDAGEPQSYENFLRALTAQLRYLSASYRDAPDGVPRLVALMALIYAGLCIAEQQAVVDRYAAAVLQGARPADPARRRAHLAQPGQRWSSCCSISCRSAMLHGARPRCRRSS